MSIVSEVLLKQTKQQVIELLVKSIMGDTTLSDVEKAQELTSIVVTYNLVVE